MEQMELNARIAQVLLLICVHLCSSVAHLSAA